MNNQAVISMLIVFEPVTRRVRQKQQDPVRRANNRQKRSLRSGADGRIYDKLRNTRVRQRGAANAGAVSTPWTGIRNAAERHVHRRHSVFDRRL
jgi:hypothetical protein